jgi:hypothetical protein
MSDGGKTRGKRREMSGEPEGGGRLRGGGGIRRWKIRIKKRKVLGIEEGSEGWKFGNMASTGFWCDPLPNSVQLLDVGQWRVYSQHHSRQLERVSRNGVSCHLCADYII